MASMTLSQFDLNQVIIEETIKVLEGRNLIKQALRPSYLMEFTQDDWLGFKGETDMSKVDWTIPEETRDILFDMMVLSADVGLTIVGTGQGAAELADLAAAGLNYATGDCFGCVLSLLAAAPIVGVAAGGAKLWLKTRKFADMGQSYKNFGKDLYAISRAEPAQITKYFRSMAERTADMLQHSSDTQRTKRLKDKLGDENIVNLMDQNKLKQVKVTLKNQIYEELVEDMAKKKKMTKDMVKEKHGSSLIAKAHNKANEIIEDPSAPWQSVEEIDKYIKDSYMPYVAVTKEGGKIVEGKGLSWARFLGKGEALFNGIRLIFMGLGYALSTAGIDAVANIATNLNVMYEWVNEKVCNLFEMISASVKPDLDGLQREMLNKLSEWELKLDFKGAPPDLKLQPFSQLKSDEPETPAPVPDTPAGEPETPAAVLPPVDPRLDRLSQMEFEEFKKWVLPQHGIAALNGKTLVPKSDPEFKEKTLVIIRELFELAKKKELILPPEDE
jgi:hypothetical protein